ncbi:MAG: UDP-N-acetylglucosamine 2-epimerase (non-hydrolyzing), partial [Chloroflexota bacterium]
MRLVSIVGTRPQLIKAAALGPALRARHEEVFVDTGQHWDDELAGVFFAELGLPRPDVSLGIGGGSASEQVGRMLPALEAVLVEVRADAVLVYGDTNSTLAGALAAAQRGLPLAHVEAGLRSFDRTMPEEVNRVVADHLARWCFAPTPTAVANLAAEGIRDGVVLVGDVLQDLAARTIPEIRDPKILVEIGRRLLGDEAALAPGGYLFATVHRAANRSVEAMRRWLGLLAALGRPERPVVLPLHPGTRAAIEAAGLAIPTEVAVVPPVGYR